MKLAEIYVLLKNDVQYIEKELDISIDTRDPILYKSAHHLLKAGGKRIRPVFVLLSGKFGDYDIDRLKHIAVALELIHMATLVHDDVIDNADLRRGKETVKSKWDNRIAMYTGDYVLGKALMHATELQIPRLHRVLSKAIVQMCVGEIEQIKQLYRFDQTIRDYLRRIKRKTALLIAISCQLGAIASNAPEKSVRALYNYGYNVGMAFQITDDILDFIGDPKKLGKPAGSDLRQGNITLPAIFCLQQTEQSSYLHSLLTSHQDNNDQTINKAIEIIRSSEGIDYAKALSMRYINRALHWLNELPEGKANRSLREIAMLITERQF